MVCLFAFFGEKSRRCRAGVEAKLSKERDLWEPLTAERLPTPSFYELDAFNVYNRLPVPGNREREICYMLLERKSLMGEKENDSDSIGTCDYRNFNGCLLHRDFDFANSS